MSQVLLSATTKEVLTGRIRARVDPTASDIEFNMTAYSEESPGVTWTAGTWNGAYGSDGWVDVLTPIIGVGDFALTEGSLHKLWTRWSHGSEVPEPPIATIIKAV